MKGAKVKKNTRQAGTEYEQYAAEWLSRQGYRILENNYRIRYSEIDLIAMDGEYYCFIEVKYRTTDECGSGFEAVDHRKQTRICLAARKWLLDHNLTEWTPCRFDVVSISGDPHSGGSTEVIQNAFEYHTK